MHLDDERVQRLVHGELTTDADSAARTHLASCADCARRADQARLEEQQLTALLRHLDGDPPPHVSAHEILARARTRRTRRGTRARRAATILLALGVSGAAYAAAGAPIPAWLAGLVDRLAGSASSPAFLPSAPDPDAGIAVVPGVALTIEFALAQARGVARITLTDEPEVVVRASGGAAAYTSDLDRLVIDNAGAAADFYIEVPRAAPRIEIRVAGTRIFLKDGTRIEAASSDGSPVDDIGVARTESADTFVLSLARH